MKWTKKDIIKYYKANSFAYSLWGPDMHYGYWDREDIKTQREASLRFNEVMAEKAGITEEDTVLDAGCGVGGASIYLAKTFGCRATGITITDNQVDQAYKRAEKAGVSHLTDFYRMDFEKTSFQDKTFSVVWGLESICYAQSKEGFLKEAFRVLKDGGRVIIADGFASRREYHGKDAKLMQRWLDGWIVNHLNTGEEFREFAERIGYNKSEYTDVTDYVKKTSWIMFLVSLPFLPLHIIDQFIRIKQYPTDALFHQYFAMRKKLWEYGIFYAEK